MVRLVKSYPPTAEDYRICCELNTVNLTRCRKAYRREERNLYIFLVGVDSKTNIGHWVVVYFSPVRKSCFWDSYGFAPSVYDDDLYHFICELSPHDWTFNSEKIQHINSCVCGAYCVYFAVEYSSGKSVDIIIRPFTKNHHFNDRSVFYWLKNFARNISLPPYRQLLKCDFNVDDGN
jgi:hypothetical protein